MFKSLNELRNNARESGIREAIKIMFKKYGWKLGVAIFMYYLIRDVTLYIIIPYLVYKPLGVKGWLSVRVSSSPMYIYI